jgi:hypothetical protein
MARVMVPKRGTSVDITYAPQRGPARPVGFIETRPRGTGSAPYVRVRCGDVYGEPETAVLVVPDGAEWPQFREASSGIKAVDRRRFLFIDGAEKEWGDKGDPETEEPASTEEPKKNTRRRRTPEG